MFLENKYTYDILLVEDNLALNSVLTEILTNAGHNVLSFDNAESIPENIKYDIAVIDLNLPGEDGLSLSQRLKIKDVSVGIILMTIRSELSDRLKGYNIGADVYLSKPTDPNELMAVINSLGRRISKNEDKVGSIKFNYNLLSQKELALLKYIARGFSYNESATILEVSLSTVQTHIRSIYLKLGAHSKIEAIQKAKEQNLL
tara:strand:+ start:1549 stop:2154 length:606 start_codon:yes stop_codon:yes gene_type:complete